MRGYCITVAAISIFLENYKLLILNRLTIKNANYALIIADGTVYLGSILQNFFDFDTKSFTLYLNNYETNFCKINYQEGHMKQPGGPIWGPRAEGCACMPKTGSLFEIFGKQPNAPQRRISLPF